MSNRRYNQFYYTPHRKAVQIDCSFLVSSANTNGLGVASLKSSGSGVANVFMKTSATPAGGNPNPQNGIIVVQLADTFNQYFFGTGQIFAPASGTDLSVKAVDAALTVGNVYSIVTLGTTTAAEWVTLGVPVGITPAVGVSFIAAVTGAGAGTAKVQVPAATGVGIYNVQVIGDPNTTISSKAGGVLGKSNGSQIILGCFGATSSSVTTAVLKAPANNSTVALSFVFSSSSLSITGGNE